MLLMDRDTRYPRPSPPGKFAIAHPVSGKWPATLEGSNTPEILQAWSEGSDVYVHADEPTALVVALLRTLPNTAAVEYCKPNVAGDGNWSPANKTEDAKMMVRSVVQWWRLRAVWAMVRSTEERCNHRHEAVVRVRGDLRVQLPLSTPSLRALLLPLTARAAEPTSNSVILASDYAFAADRATMGRIARFYDHIEAGEFYADPLRCHAVDHRLLLASDWEEHGPCLLKYNWLTYPRAVFDALPVKSCRAITHRMGHLRSALQAAFANGSRAHVPMTPCGSCFPGNLDLMRGFESERTFLTYLLSSGIRIRRWPVPVRLGSLKDGCCCAGARASRPPIGMID